MQNPGIGPGSANLERKGVIELIIPILVVFLVFLRKRRTKLKIEIDL
jgi:hypothetical protein